MPKTARITAQVSPSPSPYSLDKKKVEDDLAVFSTASCKIVIPESEHKSIEEEFYSFFENPPDASFEAKYAFVAIYNALIRERPMRFYQQLFGQFPTAAVEALKFTRVGCQYINDDDYEDIDTTLFYFAIFHKQWEAAKFFLAHYPEAWKINLKVCPRFPMTPPFPFAMAVKAGQCDLALTMAKQEGAAEYLRNFRDGNGNNVFHYIARTGNSELGVIVIDRTFEMAQLLWEQNNEKQTPRDISTEIYCQKNPAFAKWWQKEQKKK